MLKAMSYIKIWSLFGLVASNLWFGCFQVFVQPFALSAPSQTASTNVFVSERITSRVPEPALMGNPEAVLTGTGPLSPLSSALPQCFSEAIVTLVPVM